MKTVGVRVVLAVSASVSLTLFAALAGCNSSSDATDTGDAAVAGNPNGKGAGGECTVGSDCKSGICDATMKCTPPETDVGHGCTGPSDCESKVCTGGTCQTATSKDGVKNGTETDVDCGGPGAGTPRCADTKTCAAATDCTSAVCGANKKCAKPTATDGVKNGDETDVDCGGTTTSAPKCAVAKACLTHEDCASDGCDDTKHCANGRSCTQEDGGRTCGVGEVGAAGAVHESCCGALPVPGGSSKLDKYKITAGRMRAFIERTNGNVLGWYTTNKASLTATQVSQIDPFTSYLPSDLTTFPYGANYQLGGTIYLPMRPSDSQGCFVGSATNQANGSHTYWNGTLEQEDRGFDQKFLDRLPLNCVTYPMLAAFCAWDGGRLETNEEHMAAYGPGKYPWGSAPDAGGYGVVSGVFQLYGPATAPTGACPSCDPDRVNWHISYQFPVGGNTAKPWDYAYFMSAPGRFPMGAGAGGHQDIAGLQMEITANVTSNDTTTDLNGQSVTQPKVKWSKNGSWEGHAVGYAGFEFAIMTKYGKTGGRCARD